MWTVWRFSVYPPPDCCQYDKCNPSCHHYCRQDISDLCKITALPWFLKANNCSGRALDIAWGRRRVTLPFWLSYLWHYWGSSIIINSVKNSQTSEQGIVGKLPKATAGKLGRSIACAAAVGLRVWWYWSKVRKGPRCFYQYSLWHGLWPGRAVTCAAHRHLGRTRWHCHSTPAVYCAKLYVLLPCKHSVIKHYMLRYSFYCQLVPLLLLKVSCVWRLSCGYTRLWSSWPT